MRLGEARASMTNAKGGATESVTSALVIIRTGCGAVISYYDALPDHVLCGHIKSLGPVAKFCCFYAC